MKHAEGRAWIHSPGAGRAFMVEIGADAPDFKLVSQNNEWHTGAEHKGSKVVLAFFPAAFTGVCTTEMCTFQSRLGELNEADAGVYGICVDARFTNAAFAKANDISFPILSDYTRETINAYGIAHEDFAGMPGYTVSKRAVFIVDEQGDVCWKWVADSPGNEPDYDAVIAAL